MNTTTFLKYGLTPPQITFLLYVIFEGGKNHFWHKMTKDIILGRRQYATFGTVNMKKHEQCEAHSVY